MLIWLILTFCFYFTGVCAGGISSMASQLQDETSADRNVEIWKIKKLIKSLEMARG